LAESRGRRSLEKFLEDLKKGDVIAVSFPFSDGVGAKRRPVLVLWIAS
jgi:hypothetical protein